MKKPLFFSLTLLPLIANAQTFKAVLQSAIDDYYKPILVLTIIISAAAGLQKNWELINDKHDESKRKEGMTQAGMIALYVFLVIAIIGVAVGLATGLTIDI